MDPPPEKKRLFVSGLFDGITEGDLIEKFSRFGQVDSVKLTVRQTENEQTNTFAFLEMMITPKQLAKCFNVYSNTRWKGCSMKLEIAKESFLSRLQKEREQASQKSQNAKSTLPAETEQQPARKMAPSDEKGDDEKRVRSRKRTKDSPSPIKASKSKVPMFCGTAALVKEEDSGSVSPDTKPAKKLKLDNDSTFKSEPQMQPYQISNKDARNFPSNGYNGTPRPDFQSGQHLANQKPRDSSLLTRLEKFSGIWNDFEVVGSETKMPSTIRTVSEKRILSDKKRLESMHSKLSQSNAKQKLIKDALKNLDLGAKVNSKIVFDDEMSDSKPVANRSAPEKVIKKERRKNSEEGRGMTLFDSDSEEDPLGESEDIFQVKPQYEGEAGQKLIELRSQFGNDERFKIDERFANDDSEKNQDEDLNSKQETERQLGVLSRVLGRELQPKSKDRLAEGWKKMERYDPTKKNAELEIPKEEESDTNVDAPLPEVSQERYYKVNASLKDIFNSGKNAENDSFSLLQSLGAVASSNDTRNEPEPDEKAIKLPRMAWDSNPFKYDSSSDEEGETLSSEGQKTQRSKKKSKTNEKASTEGNKDVKSAARKTFFIFDGDCRLEDGVKFFVRPDNLDEIHQTWSQTRVKLMEEFKEKLKKMQQKKVEKTKVVSAAKKRFDTMKTKFQKKVFKRKQK